MDPKHLALLRIHDACQGLSASDVDAIAANIDVVHVNAGERVHSAGQKPVAVYIVVAGRLKISLKMPDGQSRTIRYIGAGDQFGALMLASDEEMPIDVIVDQTATLLRLRKEVVSQLVEEIPRFRRNLLQKIGYGVRDSLVGGRRKKSVSKVVSFLHVDETTVKLIAEIASRLAQIGEKIGILCDPEFHAFFDPGLRCQKLRDQPGDEIDRSKLTATLQKGVDLDRIFFVLDRTHPAEKLPVIVEPSDSVFCVSRPDNFQPAVDDLERLIQQSTSWKKKVHFIWALGDSDQVAPRLPELTRFTVRDFKVKLSGSREASRLFDQGIDRIVHYLRGISIGLALSGGAAHGMTHLGVLQAFEEAGITIDKIAGTSAGVLTGVIYCAGYTPEWGINQFAHDLEPGSFFKWLPKGDGFYMLEKYRSKSWDKMLRKYLQDWRLEQLPVPVNTLTTDLVSAQSVARSTGDAVNSILESINLPVLSPPICRDGQILVDGGILNNLPADVLVDQGCNFVIGVDVAANIEHRMGDNYPDTPTEKMKTPGIIPTLMRCLSVQAHNMSAVGSRPADVTIAPDVSMFDSTAFVQAAGMAEIGHQTTIESLPRIREILNNLDSDLFVI